jgi:hypothetical protein
MSTNMRCNFKSSLPITVLIFCLISGCKQAKPIPESGDEWLAFTPKEKQRYVIGFVEGWMVGSSKACRQIDDFTVLDNNKSADTARKLENVLPSPSAFCMHIRPEFSKMQVSGGDMTSASIDVSAYTNVLDDFYRHSECRRMPYSILLEHLNDEEFKSGEELYKFVRSGPGWGAFSGFDGIEKCLPGYR